MLIQARRRGNGHFRHIGFAPEVIVPAAQHQQDGRGQTRGLFNFGSGAEMVKWFSTPRLALAVGWILLLPAARPSLNLPPRLWRVVAFWFIAALPFVCLRLQIASAHYESGWAGYALRNPGTTLSSWPGIFAIVLLQQFVSLDFASWGAGGGGVEWTGKWTGISSLYNHWTLGLAWLYLFLTVGVWFAAPGRRHVIVWSVAVVVSAIAALSGVFASFVSIRGLPQVITAYTDLETAVRYLFPILVAWFATMMTAAFAAAPSIASTAGAKAPPNPPGPTCGQS